MEELAKGWDINDSRAQRITRKVGEMIAINSQPFSIAKDVGFKRVLKEMEPCYRNTTLMLLLTEG